MISIIGAGPCGSYTAYLLARAGFEVSVFEEHASIGEPVHCTGIVTPVLERLIELKKEFIVNRINTARIYAPNKDFIEIKLKENIVLDRMKFDAYLAEKAKRAGASFFMNHKFVSLKKRDENILVRIKDNKKNEVKENKTTVLIGADGPLSSVAKSAGMFGERRFFIGLQNVIEEKNNNIVEFYPLKKGIAWVVPENNERVRAGVAVRENIKNNYAGFVKKRFGEDYKKRVVSQQSGLIPLYNPRIETQKQNMFLVGDAATQVKSTSLGGIIPGLMASKALAKSIIKYESYERNWKTALGKELGMSLMMRKILDGFSDKDYNILVKLCNNKKIKKMLGDYERDFPSRFLLKMIVAEPRLIYFAKYFHRLF